MSEYRVEIDEWGEEDYIKVIPWRRRLWYWLKSLKPRQWWLLVRGRRFVARRDGLWSDPQTWGRKRGSPGDTAGRWDRVMVGVGRSVELKTATHPLGRLTIGGCVTFTQPTVHVFNTQPASTRYWNHAPPLFTMR